MIAAPGNRPGVPELLLESGADGNARGGYRRTTLSIARGNNHDAIVELLVEQGAVPSSHGGCAKQVTLKRRDVR